MPVSYNQDKGFTQQEIEYLTKVDWLWQQLSSKQRSRITYSVTNGTLKQESGQRCFIAQAINTNKVKTPLYNGSLFSHIRRLVDSIFYEGPSFDFLLERKISEIDRQILHDIYYARIGNREQYHRATALVRAYVSNPIVNTQ